jgi:hypothetical protein
MKQYVLGERGKEGVWEEEASSSQPVYSMTPYDTVCGGSHSKIQKQLAGTRGYSHSLTDWSTVSMRMPH